MKFILSAVCFITALAIVAATDAGHFIPKAFYTLDAEGHKSDLHAINPHTAHYLRRIRRQTFSSSSSSSSVSSNGGPVIFTSQQVVQQSTPQVSFASRFGESSANNGAYTPQKTTGHIISTTGHIDNTGQIHYKTQEGHF